RYTIWLNNNFRSTEAYADDRVYAKEFYDYQKDPLEKVNVVDDASYKKAVKEVHEKMLEYFKSQQKK
ncbi:MAG: sulfatase, partial [Sphingobacteriales bacterium]|nr:sulfatase [Sphingobacteriales bacterium]